MLGLGAAAVSAPGWCGTSQGEQGKVVVVGGGYGGATAAKYIRMWSGGSIAVTLVDRDPLFISCPLSNLVLGGHRDLESLTLSRDSLRKNHGVTILGDDVTAIDPTQQQVILKSQGALSYDRLVLSPGVVPMYDAIPGLAGPEAQRVVLHAWKAGPETLALRAQLEAMEDGGVYAIHIPLAPYRCPPGPYERACQVASYFKERKPRSKVLIFDANPDIVSKKNLFMQVWEELYPEIVEYHPNSELVDVDSRTRTAKLVFEDVRADVLNIVPPQRAPDIARSTGLVTANDRWCEVDFLTFESKVHKNIHVLGDAILAADKMPKSGHMANQHAKVCADAVIALLTGKPLNEKPVIANNCYSFVSKDEAVHVSSVHAYDAGVRSFVPVPDSGGLSEQASRQEATYANAWARNIWADMFS
jgi:NADPH-dependent 2,4-dienoyl-CoA reductase/sulfur reductase-like enzyme